MILSCSVVCFLSLLTTYLLRGSWPKRNSSEERHDLPEERGGHLVVDESRKQEDPLRVEKNGRVREDRVRAPPLHERPYHNMMAAVTPAPLNYYLGTVGRVLRDSRARLAARETLPAGSA